MRHVAEPPRPPRKGIAWKRSSRAGTSSRAVSYTHLFHTVKIFRELSKGNIDFLWSAHNNWAVSLPNLTRFLGRGDKKGVFDAFVCVSEVYPTLSTQYADVVLPAAMWVEREGQFGNGERRTAVFEKAVDPPGEAKWDLWMLMEVAKRVLEGEKIDGKDAFDVLFGE